MRNRLPSLRNARGLRLLPALLAWLAVLPACGGAQEAAQPRSAAEAQVQVQSEAEQIYVEAMARLANGSLIEAEQDFLRLLKMPSYLALTALARLRLGDAQFHQSKYDEAIETYLSFVQRHEGNENVPYALFMAAKAHFELAPSDVWFMPPAYELDLAEILQARQHLERFLREYPRSRYATEAIALRERCLDLQWDHSMYVVDFYRDRKQWMGVVFRLHRALQQFPGRGHDLGHYGLLADAYENVGWRARAIEMWQAIARRWPDSAEAGFAPAEIARLQREIAAAKARKEPGDMPTDLPPTAGYKPEQWAAGAGPEG